jgi:uncharacterized phage-associated protein
MCVQLDFNHRKAVQALNFFAAKSGGKINKLKALKLIFFADRYHLRKYGRSITNDEYFAMKLGPVASGVKDIAEMSDFLPEEEKEYASKFIERYNRYDIKSIRDIEIKVFSKSDFEALEFVFDKFGHMDEFAIADETHKYAEWKKHESKLDIQTRVRMNYEDFFEDPIPGSEKCYDLSPDEKTNSVSCFKDYARAISLWR